MFGIRRTDLTGSMLLRHGKNEGSVELCLSVDNREVLIKRTLKRARDEVRQDYCYIVINGRKKECSPVELKAEVLSILGYPKELLNRPKDLLYRFTVYTPQEEMKAILSEDRDARLDTLRKVFNIDRYKTIAQNSSIILRDIRERRKLIEAQISDIPEKARQKEKLVAELSSLAERIKTLAPQKERASAEIASMKNSILRWEGDIKKLTQARQEIAKCEVELNSLLRYGKKFSLEIAQLEREISSLQVDEFVAENLPEMRKKREIDIEQLQAKIRAADSKIGQFRADKSASEAAKKGILDMDSCPLCMQPVSPGHKKDIAGKEDSRIKSAEAHIALHDAELKNLEVSLAKAKSELDELRQQETRAAVARIRVQSLKILSEKREKAVAEHSSISSKIDEISSRKILLGTELKGFECAEEEYARAKKDIDALLQKERALELEIVSSQKVRESTLKIIGSIEKELQEKSALKETLQRHSQIHNWIENFFVNLAITIEKNVMAKIHAEFNGLFQRWFSMLVDDDMISVRLDDEFTPVIEQNGYESFVDTLSGGEKTSVALSYRLALNRVINDVVSTINTKDIIILDEPTDGFSTEQLDKVRDVLSQLGMKQVIIVSHESKIESFVDHVIKISKGDNGSEVVA